MLAFGSNVYALPTGGAVSAGSASIASGAGKTTINQSSQNVAINWQSFSIGADEAVQFVQPNSSSVALNRVLGPDPSSILGSLSANGKVFLVNPNGILFGKGAQVNVGGLVASTLNITDSDFMAGNYKFAGAGSGTILNQGSINADGGYVALLGANVSNEGVISARLGTVALAAGNAMTLDVAGDGLLNVAVNQGAVNALVQNGGLIQADGGQVLLTAQSAGNLLQSAVNNTGVIQAQTIENRNGTIRLLGDMQSGTVNVSGTLDASGTGAGQTGGSVTVTGHHVGLFGGQHQCLRRRRRRHGAGRRRLPGQQPGRAECLRDLHERGLHDHRRRHHQWQRRHGRAVVERLDARLRQHHRARRRTGRRRRPDRNLRPLAGRGGHQHQCQRAERQ